MKIYKCLNCEWIGSEDDTTPFYHWDSLYRVCPVCRHNCHEVGDWALSLPTYDGYYWLRNYKFLDRTMNVCTETTVVEVTGSMVWFFGTDIECDIDKIDGEWCKANSPA
jgi:hypothetical protein